MTKIGLSAGVPVTGNDAFFGETIQSTRRLCNIAQAGKIFASSTLSDYLPTSDLKKINMFDSLRVFKPSEEDFLKQLCEVTHSYWNDPVLTVQTFSERMGMSKSQMYRKIVSLTGYSPNEFLNEYRLKRSLKLLRKFQGNISEIAYESGFSSPSYFSKCFYKRYGFLPSDFLRTTELN
ncbi:MAG: helix-turn-helix transcriptional regulator [Bacteroidales bacterium]|nr:helix-turn-helix transcriptional regulator [Bacteroidales bacterium]